MPPFNERHPLPVPNGAIQKAMEWGADLAVEIHNNLDDNTIDLWEGIMLSDNALQLVGLIKEYKKIPEDWNALSKSQDYTNAIVKGLESKLGTVPDKARAIVTQGIVTGIEIGKFIHLCVDAGKK